MPQQYAKDKTARLSFRVNETLYNWVSARSKKLGVTPCDFARSILFQNMAAEEMLKALDTKPVAEIARDKNANRKAHQ